VGEKEGERDAAEGDEDETGGVEDIRAKGWWWVDEMEARRWDVEGETVLELGAGV